MSTDEGFLSNLKATRNLMLNAHGSSVVSSIGKGLIAFRDPHGIRPLVMGVRKEEGGDKSYVIASENAGFYALGYEQTEDILPGELVFISSTGNILEGYFTKDFRPCMFETVYFARPDAKIDDVSVYRARLRLGKTLLVNGKKDLVISLLM